MEEIRLFSSLCATLLFLSFLLFNSALLSTQITSNRTSQYLHKIAKGYCNQGKDRRHTLFPKIYGKLIIEPVSYIPAVSTYTSYQAAFISVRITNIRRNLSFAK